MKYDEECIELLGITIDELIDHYCKGTDSVLYSDQQGEMVRFKDTKYLYSVVDTSRGCGLKVIGIWKEDNK